MKNKLLDEWYGLKEEVLKIFNERQSQLDKYDVAALKFIIGYIEQIIYEYRMENLKPKNQRYAHLARMIIDRDSFVINVDLGSRLIRAERAYIDHP